MKKSIFLLLTLISIILSGCTSKPITTSFEATTKKVAGITISLQYIPEKELISMYKKEGNVYANFPGRLPKKKSIVFKLDISTEETVVDFEVNDIYLTIDNKTGQSKTKYQLLRLWGSYIEKAMAASKAKKMTNARMFEDKVIVTPDQPASGWIIFLENFPDSGDAVLTIDLTSENGDSGTVKVPIDFFPNTGKTDIFSESNEEENTEIFND